MSWNSCWSVLTVNEYFCSPAIPTNHVRNTHIVKYLLPFNSEYYCSSRYLISAWIFAIITEFCPLNLPGSCSETSHHRFYSHSSQFFIHGNFTLRRHVTNIVGRNWYIKQWIYQYSEFFRSVNSRRSRLKFSN
jgi:hypothetical protein